MGNDIREVSFSKDQMEEVLPTPHLNLPEIIEKKCLRPKDGSPYLLFICEGDEWYDRKCPHCNKKDDEEEIEEKIEEDAEEKIHVHGTMGTPRLIHDVNVGIMQVDIELQVKRYRCEKCGTTFNRVFEAIPANRQMTYRLYEQIKREAFCRPFVDVAADYGCSDTTIANIFDEYAVELEGQRKAVVAPRVLGIDEKHIAHSARAVFVDIETGRLLEMKADNKRDDIIGTIESFVDYDKNIKIVTMDMSNGYRAYVQECLPYAKIIVDKYHVYQDLYRKISKCRTQIMEAIAGRIATETDMQEKQHLRDVRELVLKNTYLFKFGEEKLAEKQSRIAAMADVCNTFPEFNHLRLIKEGFELIYQCRDRKSAKDVYEEWCKLVPPTGSRKIAEWEQQYRVSAELYADIRVFRNAMERWKTEVFNYFDTDIPYTNAAAEGLNQLTGKMNLMGNGYSFARLRAKALFWHIAAPRVKYSFNKTQVPKKSFYAGKLTDAFETIISLEMDECPSLESVFDCFPLFNDVGAFED